MIVAGSLAYHDYQGVVFDPAEAPSLQKDLGDKQHMILRNHGLLTVGPTISKAFSALYNLQRSCEMQVAAQAGGDVTYISEQAMVRSGKLVQSMISASPAKDLLWEAKLRWLREIEPDFER